MEEAVPEQEVEKINITEETITKVLKKKKDWSAPGPDGICNYWLRNLLLYTSRWQTLPRDCWLAKNNRELALRRKINIDPERGGMEKSQLSPHHVHEHCLQSHYHHTLQPRESTPGRTPTYSARSERSMRGD